MAGALVQPATLPAVVSGSRSQLRGSGKSRRATKMMGSARSHPLRLHGFTGLRGLNKLDFCSRSGYNFHSIVAASISGPKGRAVRGLLRLCLSVSLRRLLKLSCLNRKRHAD